MQKKLFFTRNIYFGRESIIGEAKLVNVNVRNVLFFLCQRKVTTIILFRTISLSNSYYNVIGNEQLKIKLSQKKSIFQLFLKNKDFETKQKQQTLILAQKLA